MQTFSHKPNQAQQPAPSSLTRPGTAAALDHPHAALAQERAGADEQESDRPVSRAGGRDHRFSAIQVYASGSIRLQPKLLVNAPSDVYEQEAERVAETIVDSPAHDGCTCGGDCPTCQAQHQSPMRTALPIQRLQTEAAGPTTAPPIVEQVLRASGHPLDSATSDFFAPRFGHDFSRVRIHSDAQAAGSAQSIAARAYTAGHAIVFGPGQYQPATSEGRRLLAHELTHVVQQTGSDSAVHAARIQRTALHFSGCDEPPHTLEDFRVIPEDDDKAIFAPEAGKDPQGIDGFLWRPVREHWYKVPDGCQANVVCSVDEEGYREIDPEGDCSFLSDLFGGGGTRWESMDSVPGNARPWPWPE